MSTDSAVSDSASTRQNTFELFLISLLILFLELACIRWFSAHVLFLTFFTNTVLLACFLGMSLGCLIAGTKRNFFPLTPVLLGVLVGAALGLEAWMEHGAGRYRRCRQPDLTATDLLRDRIPYSRPGAISDSHRSD